ncbi:MAG: Bax inhibitor-1 family protein [Ruthenibacterium lactatiformans]
MNEQQGLDPMFQENGSQWMEGGLASEPLNVYTAKTFGWMFLGLLVTFGTAIAFSAGGGLYYLLTMGMPAVFALAIAEIVVVMVLSARLHKLSIGAARGLFFAYAVLNGITFSAVFFAYDVQILLTVFALTSLYFCEGTRNIEVGTRNIKLTTLDKGRQRLILARWKHDK